MKAFIILTILFSGWSSKLNISQKRPNECQNHYDFKLKMNVYEFVDEMPEYIGGQKEMVKFIAKNLAYPDQDVFQGSLKLTFVIDVSGNHISEKIVNKEIDNYTALDKEGLRVVRLMPKWKPGRCNKIKVPVRVFIPITF